MGVQRTYFKNQRAAEISDIEHEFALFMKKYDKLAASVTSISGRAAKSEKENVVLNNLTVKLQNELRLATTTIAANTSEVQARLEVEVNNKLKVVEKTNKKLEDMVRDSEKIMKTLHITIRNKTEDLIEMTKKVDSIEQSKVTLENKINKIVGRVASAKNKIVSLNASTPYRPGAVERALRDVLEELRNV